MTVSIPERAGATADVFRTEILPAGQPVVFRGLVADWPVVAAGRRSAGALCDYLERFDAGRPVIAVYGPPELEGRLFYNDDLSGFNFQRGLAPLSETLNVLRRQQRPAPAVAVQAVPARDYLPGFDAENPFPLMPDVEPRLWLGTAVTVAAHHDPSENIACVAAGRRRFTLFPPEQVANLYPGPFELTPAGATISMVSFDAPDFARHPRFAEALEAAQTAELEPGDAIYIPYHWWHHVRSLDAANLLVNYWPAPAQIRPPPRDALMLAMLSIKDLPRAQREAWRVLFEHYVFEKDGPPGAHLPANRRGILDTPSPETVRALCAALHRSLDGEP